MAKPIAEARRRRGGKLPVLLAPMLMRTTPKSKRGVILFDNQYQSIAI
jgi:hypothetical protein